MRLVTANIKDNPDMPDAHVRHDIRSIWRWKRRWTVAGWQEIGEREDHRAIARYFSRSRGFRQLFVRRPTPISLRQIMWAIVETYWVRTHGGKRRVSPHRGYSTVIVKHRTRRGLKQIAIINTHYVSGAWYGDHTYRAWRRTQWNAHHARIQQEVASLNARGISVVVLGDFNRKGRDIPAISPNAIHVAGHHYDHIYVCRARGGARFRVADRGVYRQDLFTDHKPVWADIRWS